MKQFTNCNRGSLLLHAHKYLHEGFRRQALDSMSAVSNRICFYKSVFANLRFEVYSLLQNQHWFELISSGLVCSLRHSLPQSPIICTNNIKQLFVAMNLKLKYKNIKKTEPKEITVPLHKRQWQRRGWQFQEVNIPPGKVANTIIRICHKKLTQRKISSKITRKENEE